MKFQKISPKLRNSLAIIHDGSIIGYTTMDIYFKFRCWEIGNILKRKHRINLLGFNLGLDPLVDVEIIDKPCNVVFYERVI